MSKSTVACMPTHLEPARLTEPSTRYPPLLHVLRSTAERPQHTLCRERPTRSLPTPQQARAHPARPAAAMNPRTSNAPPGPRSMTPRSVMMPWMSSAGVTSKPGFHTCRGRAPWLLVLPKHAARGAGWGLHVTGQQAWPRAGACKGGGHRVLHMQLSAHRMGDPSRSAAPTRPQRSRLRSLMQHKLQEHGGPGCEPDGRSELYELYELDGRSKRPRKRPELSSLWCLIPDSLKRNQCLRGFRSWKPACLKACGDCTSPGHVPRPHLNARRGHLAALEVRQLLRRALLDGYPSAVGHARVQRLRGRRDVERHPMPRAARHEPARLGGPPASAQAPGLASPPCGTHISETESAPGRPRQHLRTAMCDTTRPDAACKTPQAQPASVNARRRPLGCGCHAAAARRSPRPAAAPRPCAHAR